MNKKLSECVDNFTGGRLLSVKYSSERNAKTRSRTKRHDNDGTHHRRPTGPYGFEKSLGRPPGGCFFPRLVVHASRVSPVVSSSGGIATGRDRVAPRGASSTAADPTTAPTRNAAAHTSRRPSPRALERPRNGSRDIRVRRSHPPVRHGNGLAAAAASRFSTGFHRE